MGNKLSTSTDPVKPPKEIFVERLTNETHEKFADVIIAFVDTSWNSEDEILEGLNRIGGNRFVSEWNKIKQSSADSCQVGDVFCVPSGGLPCRHLLFAVCREKDETDASDDQIKFIVHNMLERAKSLDSKVNTVAIPLGCGMNVETHVKIINNVFLWLMAFESDTVTHLHFLASNQIVENTLMKSLQGFEECIQQRTNEEAENQPEIIGKQQTELPEVETDPDIDITREDTIRPLQLPHNVMSADSASTFNGQRNDITSEDTIKPTIFYRNENETSNGTMEGHSRYDDYPNNSPRTYSIISSEGSEEGFTYIKSVDKFPEKESIWKYYVGSKEDFKTISNKKRPRTVQIDEEALEYDFETGRPVRRTLSQSSVDETPLDHKNFEPKRKIKRRQRRNQPTKVKQTNPSPETPPQPFFCSICQNTKDESCKRVLQKCGHSFCSDCIRKYFEDVSPSCPNCKEFYGVPLGNQPYGLMSHRIVNQYLPGYQGTDTIIIEYDIPDGIQSDKHPNPGVKFKGTFRRAYLPYNEKGCKVHRMLRKAFSQQLIFTVGKSVTTGKENVVTWNDIHHKTNADGGPERFGYPDPEYLDRVLEQLRKAGITDIDDKDD